MKIVAKGSCDLQWGKLFYYAMLAAIVKLTEAAASAETEQGRYI